MGGYDIQNAGVIMLKEQADANSDVAGEGQIWVDTATPNVLYFTDDAGTDFRLSHTNTGSGNNVLATSPTFVTPALGTPASGVATNLTGNSGITGLGTQVEDLEMGGYNIQNAGVITLKEQTEADADVAGEGQIWVDTATPNVLYFTDDTGTDFRLSYSNTGSGNNVLATSPTLVTPALGTPSALVLTNATALPAAQVAQGTMASGMVLVAPVLGTPASGALTNCTALPAAQVSQGTMASGMVLVAPVLGTPASGALTNCTALPAAQVSQGTMASGMVLVAPVLGTPASGALTNCTALPAAQVSQGTLASGMVLVAPVLGTPASGNLANCTFPTANINTNTGVDMTIATLKTKLAGGFAGNAVTIGDSDDVVTMGNKLIVTGDLTVSGSTTTVNTATLTVEDPLIKLASGNGGADAVDIGLFGLYDTSGSLDLFGGLFRDASDSGKWKLFKDSQADPGTGTTVNTSGTGYAVATLVADLEGDVTGDVTGDVSGDCGGTAADATVLETARNINGVSFNGSADITVTAAGSTLSDTVTVAKGGTSATTLTSGYALLGNGQSAPQMINSTADSTMLVGNGSTMVAETGSTLRTSIGVDAAGTDNSTDVTLGNTNYLSISGQAITGGTVPVGSGGTGATSLTDGGILLGSNTGAITAMAVLTDGQMIVGDGSGDPVAESGATLRTSIGVDSAGTDNSTNVDLGNTNYLSLSGQTLTGNTVPVGSGGTGTTSLTNGGVLLGSGTGAVTAMAVLNDGEMIVGDGSVDPVVESGATLRTSIGVGYASAGDVQTGTEAAKVVTPDTLAAKSVIGVIDVSSMTGDNIVTVTHNLGTANVIVEMYDIVTDQTIYADVYRTTDNLSTASTSVISIQFGATAPTNDINCLITSVKGATTGLAVAYT